MKNYPKIYNNDIKVLGRVVSIATENKVAAAEQVFDERFKYSELDSYSWDNADLTKAGLDQYTINRLFGKKLKKLDDNIQFDGEGWVLSLKVRNLIAGNISADTINTKNINVSENAEIKNLRVTNSLTFKDLNIEGLNQRVQALETWKSSIDTWKSTMDSWKTSTDDWKSSINSWKSSIDTWKSAIDSWKSSIDSWKSTVESRFSNHEGRIAELESCCATVQSMINNLPSQGGVIITVNPNPIDITVGDADVALSVSSSPALAGNYTIVSNDTSIATIVNNKVHAVSRGNTTISINWGGVTKDIPVNVTMPTYRIVFNPNNGQSNFHQDVTSGNKLVAVTNPVRDGYTFNGWHVNSETGAVWDFNTPVTSQMTLIGGWTRNTFTVTFNVNGGTPAISSQTVGLGDTIQRPTDPTYTGYIFDGWNYNGSKWNFTNGVYSNMTLVANWVPDVIPPQSITIVGPDQVTAEESATYTASISPSNANTQTGITWSIVPNTNQNAGRIDGNNNTSTYTAPGTVGLVEIIATAQNGTRQSKIVEIIARPVEYVTITFDSNGGTAVNPSTQSVPKGTAITKPADPTKADHTFDGWRQTTAVNGFEAGHMWDFQDTVNENMTLRAEWNETNQGVVPVSSVTIVGPDEVNMSLKYDNNIQIRDGFGHYTVQFNDGANEGTAVTWSIIDSNGNTLYPLPQGVTSNTETYGSITAEQNSVTAAVYKAPYGITNHETGVTTYDKARTVILKAESNNGTVGTKTISIVETAAVSGYTVSWTCTHNGESGVGHCSIKGNAVGYETVYEGQSWSGHWNTTNGATVTITIDGDPYEWTAGQPIQINNIHEDHVIVLAEVVPAVEHTIRVTGSNASYRDYSMHGGAKISLEDGKDMYVDSDKSDSMVIDADEGYEITGVTISYDDDGQTVTSDIEEEGEVEGIYWAYNGSGNEDIVLTVTHPTHDCSVTIITAQAS